MRRDPQQRLTFPQRLPYQPKLKVLEVSQPTMNEARRSGTRPATDVTFINQQHFQPAHRRIARDTRTVDPRANNYQIKLRVRLCSSVAHTIWCYQRTI